MAVLIVDLAPEYEAAWLHCLEPYSELIGDGVERKGAWYQVVRQRGLIVKLAIADDGAVAGMVQALPIEQTWVHGERLYFILCIWVHGHDATIGDRRGAGFGRALLQAIEAEIRLRGAMGVAAWGLALPFWMRASWFKKQGYTAVDQPGVATLLWKPFSEAARPPAWAKAPPVLPPLAPDPRKVTVTCFENGWCPMQNGNCERARRAAERAGHRVVFHRIDTLEPKAAKHWGQTDAIWVGHRPLRTGPPLAEDTICKAIDKELRSPWWRSKTRTP